MYIQAAVVSLQKLHKAVTRSLMNTSKPFRNDGPEVQRCWASYVEKIDLMLEESIKSCVKKSLLSLSHLINGDGKTDALPAFKAHVMLKDSIVLDATFNDHEDAICDTASSICHVCDQLERLSQLAVRDAKYQKKQPPYSDRVTSDPEVIKLFDAIPAGFGRTIPGLEAFLDSWNTRYSFVWTIQKDPFIQRYAEARPPLFKFEADIGRYEELATSVQKEETLVPLNFMLLDSSPLKQALAEHCTQWRSKLTEVSTLAQKM